MLDKIFNSPERDPATLKGYANELLNNPIWQECYKAILRGVAEQMLGSAPNETAKREGLYLQAHALFQLEAELNRLAAHNVSES